MPKVLFTGQLKNKKNEHNVLTFNETNLKNVTRMCFILRSGPSLILVIKVSWKN